MRLNGKRQACAYLGVNPQNRRAWRAVKAACGAALWRLPGRRVWVDSAALDEIDRARPVGAVLHALAERQGRANRGRYVYSCGSQKSTYERYITVLESFLTIFRGRAIRKLKKNNNFPSPNGRQRL